jgi:pimeloyl-ACP methyl ester carboxylesterase
MGWRRKGRRGKRGVRERVNVPYADSWTRGAMLVVALLLVCSANGCRWTHARGAWCDAAPPSGACAREIDVRCRSESAYDCGTRQLVAATDADVANGNAARLYYEAAAASALVLEAPDVDARSRGVAWDSYQASLKGLLVAATRNRHSAESGALVVNSGGRVLELAVSMHGFAWDVADVQQLIVVDDYRAESLSRVHRRTGIGVPVVVQRRHRTGASASEQFLIERSAFAATAVLRVEAGGGEAGGDTCKATIELYNPYAIAAIDFGGQRVPLAADLSSPLAYYAIQQTPEVNPIAWFLDPGASTGEEGLYFLEPYQPGKIPIVFVHGLVSSPSTWTDMVNDLRATPGFNEHYQVWAFRYATGSSFLRAAAHLRRSLYEAAETVDPGGTDPALRATVLVGHSMGGLISKLQVVDTGNALWRSVAARPLEQINASERARRELAEALFFERHPNVRRVVFIATPHGGSSWATRPVGQIASALARSEDERSRQYARLMADNPGVFNPAVERRLPTSVDMLEPKNPLLSAMRGLPVCPEVPVHSIVGTGGFVLGLAASDGVVPEESAVHPNATSTLYVRASHEKVHREEATIREVRTILNRHLAEQATVEQATVEQATVEHVLETVERQPAAQPR